MLEADEEVEETTSQETDETNKVESSEDEKAFEEQVENFERAEKVQNKANAERRLSSKDQVDKDESNVLDIEAQVAEAIKKQLPKLQSSLAEDTIDSVLRDIASNDNERKRILWHFENSVGSSGTIRERLENAKLIANKKSILKTQKEMAVAINNRAGLGSSGMGTSTEGPQVQDQFFSQDQLNALKARGWDDKKIERLKVNLRKSKSF